MQTSYHSGRALAISAGIAATGGALGILLSDPITTGQWRLDHALLPIVVGITIAAGHLVGSAARSRKPLAALGFAGIFALGTVLTVYSSVGSQKASNGDRALAAEAHNAAIIAKRAAIERARHEQALAADMLKNAQNALHTQCVVGKRSKAQCDGIRATISTYAGSEKGHGLTVRELEAELGALGGEKIARPKAAAFAEVVAIVTGADRARIEAVAATLEPVAYSTLLELTAIVAFGFGFAHGNRRTVAVQAQPTEKQGQQLATVKAASNDDTPPKPPGNRRRVVTKAAAEADVIELVRSGPLPSQETLATRWGCHPGTASKWCSDFERRGIITRQTIGRRKTVAAA